MHRATVIRLLAERIVHIEMPHPTRVAIDGVTASGKTTLAGELAAALRSQTREVIRASVDDFHNPPEARYRRGRLSPEGYYHDTFDYPALRTLLLDPLGPGGSRSYRVGARGQPDGAPADFNEHTAPGDAILIVDGVFLFRPELNDYWDYRIFIDVDQDVALARGLLRDASWMGGPEEARRRYETRYIPGERIYLETVKPRTIADAVVTNDIFESPVARLRQ